MCTLTSSEIVTPCCRFRLGIRSFAGFVQLARDNPGPAGLPLSGRSVSRSDTVPSGLSVQASEGSVQGPLRTSTRACERVARTRHALACVGSIADAEARLGDCTAAGHFAPDIESDSCVPPQRKQQWINLSRYSKGAVEPRAHDREGAQGLVCNNSTGADGTLVCFRNERAFCAHRAENGH